MKLLALNPFHDGSHKAFMNGWMQNSRHDFHLLTLSGHHWKWRMRHSAVHFAQQLVQKYQPGSNDFKAIICTDMLNLAEFRGLAPEPFRSLPAVVYFHENQLTYPIQDESKRDLHLAFSNFLTACAADQIWFNSDYHRTEFLTALTEWLPKMPDSQLSSEIDELYGKSRVHPPGLELSEVEPFGPEKTGPMRIVWVSRWEYDKAPELFFEALFQLQELQVPFKVSVLGESYPAQPSIFAEAHSRLANEIEHWGYLNDYQDYQHTLKQADLVVSTAKHEFYGIAILEAVAAGCRPLVPNALAYPEVLPPVSDCFHAGTIKSVVEKLLWYSDNLEKQRKVDAGSHADWLKHISQFSWPCVTAEMDAELERLVN